MIPAPDPFPAPPHPVPTMRSTLVRALVALVLILPAPAAAQRAPERLFYYTDNEDGWQSLLRNVDQVSVVAPGGYAVSEHGTVWGEVDPRVVRLGRERGVPVMPLVVNPGFDQEMLHRFLASDEARARAVASLVELCRRHGHWGIQVDFENLALADRDAFTRFYRELGRALHAAGFRLSAAVVHRPDELAGPTAYHRWLFENWRAGYDLKAIGEIGDFVSIMSYNQHTRRTPPGPQHGMPWITRVLEHFLEHVPARKLSLGIITGGMHWYTSQEDRIAPEMARSYSAVVSWPRAMALVERNGARLVWDEEQQASYARFERGGTWEWVFVEDARSFEARLGLVDRHGLRGFSVWVLGPEDPGIWEVLRRRGAPPRPR
ncbi:MAG TPA: glycosyl hydrolase family 18 protein [Longimicrobiaceae bacterium]|nr:glycosyl hydrolase family 18 protein [Longimicrobiaceae bacterium]